MEDLNELLGSDSEEEVELNKETESDAKKDSLADLLGDNSDEEKQGNTESDEKIVDTKSFEDNVGIDALEQILGKSTMPSTAPNKKVKQTSKLHINEVERIPENAKSLFVRTPNFLKINCSEFDRETYDPENEKELTAATIIRWRVRKGPTGDIIVGKDGKPQLESNARLIKWDDGTYQLVIGKAIFNAKIMTTDNLYTFKEHKNQDILVDQDGNNDEDGVTVRGGNCLECIGAVDSRMILQPLSLNSSTHARVSLKISERFKKGNKVVKQELDTIMIPPAKLLDQLAKQEELEIRAARKQQLQAMEYRLSSGVGHNGPSRGAASTGKSRPSMSSSYLDDNDQYDGEIGSGYMRRPSESDKKKKKKAPTKGARRRNDDEDDQDGEDLGDEDSEDDEDEDDNDQENDSIVVDDDEEEEEDDGEDDEDEEGDAEEEDDDDDDDNASNDDEGEPKKKKKDKKKKKLSKKEKKSSRTDKKNKKKDKKDKKKDESRKAIKTKRTTELERGNDTVAADGDGEDDEENLNLHHNKRLKRTVIESDDEDDA